MLESRELLYGKPGWSTQEARERWYGFSRLKQNKNVNNPVQVGPSSRADVRWFAGIWALKGRVCECRRGQGRHELHPCKADVGAGWKGLRAVPQLPAGLGEAWSLLHRLLRRVTANTQRVKEKVLQGMLGAHGSSIFFFYCLQKGWGLCLISCKNTAIESIRISRLRLKCVVSINHLKSTTMVNEIEYMV